MIYERIVVKVARSLPIRGRLSLYLLLLFNYIQCLKKVIAWHRTQLGNLDPIFQAEQFIAARNKALADAIGPLCIRDPTIATMYSLGRRTKITLVPK